MISILFIGPIPPPYHGVSVADNMLLSSDAAKKYNIHVIDTAKGKSIGDIEKLKFKNYINALYSIIEVLIQLLFFRIDEVYVPISQNKRAFIRDSLYIKLAKLFKKKIIIHLHGGNFKNFYNDSSRLLQKYIYSSLKGVNAAIVLGNSLRYIFKDIVDDSKIYVVENGINFKADSVKKQYSKKKKILYLGNLVEMKGVLNIVRAIPSILAVDKNVFFTFVGAWESRSFKNKVMNIIQNNNLDEYVSFKGVLTGKDKEGELKESDIFLFPPYCEEGQPLVLIEAMAAGLPIITTNRGCISEMIVHDENGIIIEKNNVEDIVRAVIKLINDMELCKRFSTNNIERYKSYYTQEDFCNRFFKVVDDVYINNISERKI